MSGFKRHGIEHSSASQINMYAQSPCFWLAKYLHGVKGTFGVAPLIGILTEDVVTDVLMGGDMDNALKVAHDRFNKETALGASEKDRERITNIKDMATLALDELKPYGEPEFVNKVTGPEQQRIEILCRGSDWEITIIGYCDYVFPKHNLVVDLKTTMRAPSEMSDAHRRQGAIYAKAKEMDCKFLYVTPKKHVWHDVENVDETLAEIKSILNRQEKFLKLGDKEMLADIVPVDTASFYWKGCENERKELYDL